MIKVSILAMLVALAHSHIIMTNPVPFGRSTLLNGPLDGSGSDFPCKQRAGVYDPEGASNVYQQGSTQQLSFMGSAVHGGGSCQVAVTTDLRPDKQSVWRVIKSIEGGCPAKGQVGNMGDSASQKVPYQYDFTIPKEMSAGNYTLAWTWFNKIGNREMYMNCAPLTVTGSDEPEDFMSTLPNLFEANINNFCNTVDNTDVLFPDPGKDVDKFNGATDAFRAPVGTKCQHPTSRNGSQRPVNPSTTKKSAQQTTRAPSMVHSTKSTNPSHTTSAPGGVFISIPPHGNPPARPSATRTTTSSRPKPAPTGTSPTGVFRFGTKCSAEGLWNCIGGSMFQRCASGIWSQTQHMASGTVCQPGQSMNFEIMFAHKRRSVWHRPHNLRRTAF